MTDAQVTQLRQVTDEPLPYMALFVGDILRASALWTNGECLGLFLSLLLYEWAAGGPLPDDEDELARITRYTPKKFRELWPSIACEFVKTDRGLINPHLEQQRAKGRAVREKRRQGASITNRSRWGAASTGSAS
jgi:uncharacterized protein YdaU (DUF1376 family)